MVVVFEMGVVFIVGGFGSRCSVWNGGSVYSGSGFVVGVVFEMGVVYQVGGVYSDGVCTG